MTKKTKIKKHTISIFNPTRERLYKLRDKLEEEHERTFHFDDVINYLLDNINDGEELGK